MEILYMQKYSGTWVQAEKTEGLLLESVMLQHKP